MKKRILTKGLCFFVTMTTVLSSAFSVNAEDELIEAVYEPVEEMVAEAAAGIELKNPKEDKNMKMVWDSIYFGNYWQTDTNNDGKADINDEKQPIKWRVLSVSENDAFLISDRILDYKAFSDKSDANITWENSTIRSWLNGYDDTFNAAGIDYVGSGFIDEAFSSAEQDAITQTSVKNDYISPKGISNGNDTVDKVYLLSLDEIINYDYGLIGAESYSPFLLSEYYFKEHNKRMHGKNTPFVTDLGALTSKSEFYINNGKWILRTLAEDESSAVCDVGEFIYETGYKLNYKNGIRPVMHIDLTKADYTYAGEVVEGVVSDSDFVHGQADPSNDDYALDTSSGNIKKLVLDLSEAGKYGLNNDITISVMHGSKITIKQPVERIEEPANALEKNIKLNPQTHVCTINAKKTNKYGGGFATIVTTDGQKYTVRVRIWKPKAQSWVRKAVAERGNYDDKKIALRTGELFLTGIEGKVTATAVGTTVTVDDRSQWIFFEANPGAKINIEYKYLNKKYKTTIKIKKVKK